MTDRELLEWAAKAAGFDTIIEMYGLNDIGEPLLDANDPPTVWNPLTDDGDAFRLAVKLKLETEFGSNFVNVGNSYSHDQWHSARESGDDLFAATRRAIVRAASEIGRNLK